MKLLSFPLACLAWTCAGQRYVTDENSRLAGRHSSDSSSEQLEEQPESSKSQASTGHNFEAITSLLLAQRAPVPRLRRAAAPRNSEQALGNHRRELIIPEEPKEPKLLRASALLPMGDLSQLTTRKNKFDPKRRRSGNPRMAKQYAVPKITPERWVESHTPMHEPRILHLGQEVDDFIINQIIATMIYNDALDQTPQYLYINSPGGSVLAGLVLYDVIQHVKSDIITVNLGMAASTASLILGAGVRGKRVGTSNSGVMIHQPASGGLVGEKIDMRVDQDQIQRIKDVIVSIYSDMTDKSREQILQDISYDNYMNAEEALAYGLIDDIIQVKPEWDLEP